MRAKLLICALGLSIASPAIAQQAKGKSIEAKVVKRKKNDAKMEAKMEPADVSDKMVCSQAGLERHLELEWADSQKNAPCKVHYRKKSEDPNHHKVLWTANNDAAFCSEKAQEFVAKLEGWGWNCKSASAN